MTDKITLPYSVAAVLKEQKKLINASPCKRYLGYPLTDQNISMLAAYLQFKCNRPDVPREFFLWSLDSFRHRSIAEEELQQLLCRLVAVLALDDLPLLPVTPWLLQEKDEWIPFEVLKVVPKERAIYLFTCKALGSRMVGHTFDYKVSTKMAFRMASRAGFNQRDEMKRMMDPLQFTDLRLVLHIAKNSTPGRVKVLDCGEHPATVEYNRRVNKQRDPEFRKCLHQQRTTCFRCGIGKDKCKLAILEKTNES
jgi:hypothetical protein